MAVPNINLIHSIEQELTKLEDNFRKPNQALVNIHCTKIDKSMLGYASRNQDLDHLFNKKLRFHVDIKGNFIKEGTPLFTMVPFEGLNKRERETDIRFTNHGKKSLKFEDYYSIFLIHNDIIQPKNTRINSDKIFFRSIITTRTCKILTNSEQKIKIIQSLRDQFLKLLKDKINVRLNNPSQNNFNELKSKLNRLIYEKSLITHRIEQNIHRVKNQKAGKINNLGHYISYKERIAKINILNEEERQKIQEIRESEKLELKILHEKLMEQQKIQILKYENIKKTITENTVGKHKNKFDDFHDSVMDLIKKRNIEIENLETKSQEEMPALKTELEKVVSKNTQGKSRLLKLEKNDRVLNWQSNDFSVNTMLNNMTMPSIDSLQHEQTVTNIFVNNVDHLDKSYNVPSLNHVLFDNLSQFKELDGAQFGGSSGHVVYVADF